MKETIDKLDTAKVPWDMEAARVYVAKADEAKVKALFPLRPLEPYGERLVIRYDLPLLVELPKVDVNLKVDRGAKV